MHLLSSVIVVVVVVVLDPAFRLLKQSAGRTGTAFSRKAEELETAKEDTWIV